MARIWFIDGDAGDDIYSGTEAFPRATFPADASISNLDVFYCKNKIRGNLLATTKVVNVFQWPGQTQYQVRGDIVIAASGWSAAGNGWSKNIGAGLQLNNTTSNNDAGTANLGGVVYNWDTKIKADGRHYGHLEYATAAAVAAASGATTGKYHYSTSTGLLTIYVGGDNPNSTGVVAYVSRAGLNAVRIVTASGSTLNDGVSALWLSGDGHGYGVRCEGCYDTTTTPTRVTNWTCYDCGYHSFGAVTKAKDVIFTECRYYAAWAGQTGGFVAHTDDNSVTVTGVELRQCGRVGGRLLNFDGSGFLSGQAAAGSQTGFYAHGPGGGTPVADILITDWDETQVELNDHPWQAADTVTPSDYWDWSTYAVRVDRGYIRNGRTWRGADGIAVRQVDFDFLLSGAAGPSNAAITFSSVSASTMLIEGCAIRCDGSGQSFFVAVGIVASGHDLRLLNCSIYVTSSDSKAVFQWNFVNGYIRARGCAIEMAGAGSNWMCLNDDTTDASHHDFLDNAYRMATGEWSTNTSFNTQTEFITGIDNVGYVASAAIFPNAPTALTLDSNSAIWTQRRQTSTVVPEAGINGPYTGFFGAYQYGSFGFKTDAAQVGASGVVAGMVA